MTKTKIKKALRKYLPSYPVIFIMLICLFLGSSYIIHGDIYFFTDISRDFLLMSEILEKKLVLIGPRASAIRGLFHGPFWLYLNLPAFILGGGNPVFVGWFWVFLAFVYLMSSYHLIQKIFNRKIASLFLLFLSGQIIPLIYGFYNPIGAMIFVPSFIYSSIQYLRTTRLKYLAYTLLISGIIIQLQMAVGVPLLLLTLPPILFIIVKKRLYKHLPFLFLILLPLSTFILFDLRHDFSQVKAVISFVTNKTEVTYYTYGQRFVQRANLFLNNGFGQINYNKFSIVSKSVLFLTALKLLLGKKKTKYFSSIAYLSYLYIGYFIISLFFNGELLVYYWLPIIPIFLLLASIIISSYSKLMTALIVILAMNYYFAQGINHSKNASHTIGKIEDSWQFQRKIAESIFTQGDQEFGYFIFTPDIYAYESKAGMEYYTKKHPDYRVHIYKKQPITYLIIAPDPSFRPDITSASWKQDRVHIRENPDETIFLDDGYQIEKYLLSPEEVAIEEVSTIHDWIYFR